ncbi:TetR/AcrR family transcriptional regulator [Streptomyces sp. NPDC014995]|uniref:TetR/AcrR family transcriptional regulator n=1 Tax=Streptomyces sp. NPDC014995 TaxID=3364936 RepID=UPI0036FE0083
MSTEGGIPDPLDAGTRSRRAGGRGRRQSHGGGRRPGQSDTRDQILSAALELFAARGYSGTTMRAIAREAQVDPALIHHFFSNKEGVFRDAVSSRVDVSALFDSLAEEDDPDRVAKSPGAWVARTFLSFWEDGTTRPALVAVYRTGLSDEAVTQTFRRDIEDAFAACLRRIVPEHHDRTPAFASLVSAQLAGLVMLRYVLVVEPLASLDFEELMDWLTPSLEVHFERAAQGQG